MISKKKIRKITKPSQLFKHMTELSDQKHYTRKNYKAQSLVYETLNDEIKRKIHKKLKTIKGSRNKIINPKNKNQIENINT